MTYILTLSRQEADGDYGMAAELQGMPEPAELTAEHPVFKAALDRLIRAHQQPLPDGAN